MQPFTRYDPVRIYETPSGISTVKSMPFASGVAANVSIVAAVSGKIIRVMGWIMSGTAVGFPTVQFKNGSGGTTRTHPINVPNNAAGLNERQEIKDCGYFETSSGVGVFADIAVAAVAGTVFYIEY